MKSVRSTSYHYIGSLLAAIAIPAILIYLLFMIPGMNDEKAAVFIESPFYLLGSLAFILAAPVAYTIYSKRKGQAVAQEYVNITVIRFIVAYLMFFYGFGKIGSKFFEITYLTQDTKVVNLDSFFLTWFYFGKSNTQEVLIGLMELVPAILLLFRRTTFIGAVIMLPVALNVLMVNTFNHISGLTFPISILIAACNFYLLYYWKDEIVAFVKKMSVQSIQLKKGGTILRIFRIFIIIAIVFFVGGSLVSKITTRGKLLAGRNKILGGYELENLVVNGKQIHPDEGDTLYYKSIYLEPQARWNTIRDFSKKYNPRMLKIQWHSKSDSVVTFIKRQNDVTDGRVDSTTMFKGTYKLVGNKLYVDGIQYGDTIQAVYYKKDLKDYNWFW